ncbi:hypothetical protein T492DRAFT_961272 [Pavlovales sp. CCMP2436]|nr:hypothetical protein T492DRAFT_961272 [Pavlovales sp. CCMP2436]
MSNRLCSGFAWLACLTTVAASAGPAVVVGELFQDLLVFPRADGNRTCRSYQNRNVKAPWLSRAHLRGTFPTLRELRETMLADAFVFNASVFNASMHSCIGDSPDNMCVQAFPQRFDEFSLEVILLTRWLQEVPICDKGSCGARMVIVPSLIFHHTASEGRSWLWMKCMTAPLAAEYWRRVSARYFTPGTAGPLIVVAESYSFDNRVLFELISALQRMSAEIRARVAILTTMSNQQLDFRQKVGLAPRWQSGADAELTRRTLLLQERARLAALGALDANAVQALIPSAPLIITVPVPVGVFQHHPVDYKLSPRVISLLWDANLHRNGHMQPIKTNVRVRITRALVTANATCNQEMRRCVMCAPQTPSCAEERHTTGHTVFALSARAVVCIEPPGDVLGRSHTFVDVVTGCVPVLVEGGHPAYPKGEPTWWPWRKAPGISAAASPLRGLTLDYSAFSLLPDGGGNTNSDAAACVVRESISLAADAQRLSRMRVELARVAPLFVYARKRPPAGAPDDAFERLRKTLAVVLRVHTESMAGMLSA